MKIRELVRPGAFTVDANDWLGHAYTAMKRSHTRHVPVVDNASLVGMISERDVLVARSRFGGDWWTTPVRRAMHTPVQTAHPDDLVTQAADRMAASQLGSLPVVESGKLLGVVTVADVLDAEPRRTPAPGAGSAAADIMTPYPVTVRPEVMLLDAVVLMTDRHVRHLPVVDGSGRVVGMLSERDVRAAVGEPASYRDRAGDATVQFRVKDVMTSPAVVVRFDKPVGELARQFVDERLGALPVVDALDALVGIVSYIDVLRASAR